MADPIYFSKVKLLDGTIAEVKDEVAREAIRGGTHFIGVTTTPLTDGQTISSVVVGSETKTLANGDLVLYGSKEFIFAESDGKVHELGDMTGLKALAYKDNASGDYTPAGSVSKPGIDVNATPATIKEIDEAGSVTAGSANVPTAVAVTAGTANVPTVVQVTPGSGGTPTDVKVTAGTANTPTAVTLPDLGMSVANEVLQFNWAPGSVTPGTAGAPTVVNVTDGIAATPTAVNVTPGTAGTPTAVQVTPGVAGAPTQVVLPTTKSTSVVASVAAELHEAPAFTGTQDTITVS